MSRYSLKSCINNDLECKHKKYEVYGGEENWKVNTVQHPCFFTPVLGFRLAWISQNAISHRPAAAQCMSNLFKYFHGVSFVSFDILPIEKGIDLKG